MRSLDEEWQTRKDALTRTGKEQLAEFMRCSGMNLQPEAEECLMDRLSGHGSAGPDQYRGWYASSFGRVMVAYVPSDRNFSLSCLWAVKRPEQDMAAFKRAISPLEQVASDAGLQCRFDEGERTQFYNTPIVELRNGSIPTVISVVGQTDLAKAEAVKAIDELVTGYIRAYSP